MKRTNISLTDEQYEWLREKAHKAKISQAQVIRIWINEQISRSDVLAAKDSIKGLKLQVAKKQSKESSLKTDSPEKAPMDYNPENTTAQKIKDKTKVTHNKIHREGSNLGGGSTFSPQPKSGKKKK